MKSGIRQAMEVYQNHGVSELVTRTASYGQIAVRQLLNDSLAELIINRRGVSPEEWNKDRKNYTLHRYATAESVEFKKPSAIQPVPDFLGEHIGKSYSVPKPFVCEIPEAVIIGCKERYGRHTHAVYLDDGNDILIPGSAGYNSVEQESRLPTHWVRKHLQNVLTEHGIVWLSDHLYNKNQEFDKKFQEVCPLLGLSNLTYGHWLVNYLPRLQGLRHYNSKTKNTPTLLIHPDAPEWLISSLHSIGYDENLVRWQFSAVKCDKLIIPGPRFIHRYKPQHYNSRAKATEQVFPVFAPTAIKWVAEKTRENRSNTIAKPSKRLYISRSQIGSDDDFKSKRKIVNETEVQKELQTMGFRCISPVSLDYTTQVQLFSKAELIIGTFGSGLINMLFSKDAKVLELFGTKRGPDMVGPYQYSLATALGFDYGFLICESKGDDLKVDIDKLKKVISLLEN